MKETKRGIYHGYEKDKNRKKGIKISPFYD
jgi:hypothetical protein